MREVNHLLVHDQAGLDGWDNLSNVCLVWMVGIICLKFVWFEWLG